MKITTVLFDLDGTLLPMDQDLFTKGYFKLLAAKLAPYGYEPKQLIDAVWAGTAAMLKNDGTRSNETVFWNRFALIYGEKAKTDKPLFDDFYANEFRQAKSICSTDPRAAETVHRIQARGYRVALATNPIFPAIATEHRIRWAGLEPSDFVLCTTYENSSFCKPNTDYYREITQKLGVRPEECLMVGNDVAEDMAARELGMHVFLLIDCLICTQGTDISQYPHGSFEQLSAYLDAQNGTNDAADCF